MDSNASIEGNRADFGYVGLTNVQLISQIFSHRTSPTATYTQYYIYGLFTKHVNRTLVDGRLQLCGWLISLIVRVLGPSEI